MGFFSRRSEDRQEPPTENISVVRVIRSRFYGKQASSSSKDRTIQQSNLSNTTPSTSLRNLSSSVPSPSPRRPNTQQRHIDSRNAQQISQPQPSTSRSSTDAVTMTLAQRLNELAQANADGLLTDDEYRLLRQSLFDRFAGGAAVPQEAPLVSLAISSRTSIVADDQARHRRPSSQYHADSSRASINSNRSITSTVTSLLRRATNKQQRRTSLVNDSSVSDTTSIFSYTSTATHNTQKSSFFRKLSKQSSETSLRPSHDLYPNVHDSHDLLSVHSTPNRSRSGSVRSRATRKGRSAPPSAYMARASTVDLTAEVHHAQPVSLDTSFADGDDDQTHSAASIRKEIEKVDEERKHLLDAFAGLELSTLIKQQGQPSHGTQSLSSPPGSEDGWKGSTTSTSKLGSEQMSVRSANMSMDVDTNSLRSIGSSRTASSMRKASLIRSGHQQQRTLETGSLRRKHSTSTMNSSKIVSPVSPNPSPLSPSKSILSNSSRMMKLGSTSSVNLARSTGHLPLATVAESADSPRRAGKSRNPLPPMPPPPVPDKVLPILPSPSKSSVQLHAGVREGTEDEMSEIRRRRIEVTARYDARLEYLKAKLKGAELKEKVLRT